MRVWRAVGESEAAVAALEKALEVAESLALPPDAPLAREIVDLEGA